MRRECLHLWATCEPTVAAGKVALENMHADYLYGHAADWERRRPFLAEIGASKELVELAVQHVEKYFPGVLIADSIWAGHATLGWQISITLTRDVPDAP